MRLVSALAAPGHWSVSRSSGFTAHAPTRCFRMSAKRKNRFSLLRDMLYGATALRIMSI